MSREDKWKADIKKLNKDGDIFQGQHWCNGCRDWYEKELTACPDCNPVTSLEILEQKIKR